MILAHKIKLDPTVKQENYFTQAAGTARMVWNWGLAEWNRQYEAGLKPNGMSIQKQFNSVKYELFPWLVGIHRDAHARPFADLQAAFNRFFRKISKRPRFKVRGKSKASFAVANDRLRVDGKLVRLPIIGWVRMREEIRFEGRILAASVSQIAGDWYISFQIDIPNYCRERDSDGVVGVDLGIKTLATISTGEVVNSPNPLRFNLKKLKRLQRQQLRRRRGSSRHKKLGLRIARLHNRIRNIRHDCLHKLTAKLCRENQAVVIEDLCVKGMMRNRKLSRAVSDIGFYEFRRQMEYKSKLHGTDLIAADRFYPSSKICSNCQSIKDSLSLSERIFNCERCGFKIDRDINAAKNLHTLGLRGIDARGPEGSGAGRKASAKPCRDEARTKTRGHSLGLAN